MNRNITALNSIAAKDSRLVVGLMSGTSLDGLDVALCEISGSGLNTKLKLLAFATTAYDIEFKKEIKEIFSKSIVNLQQLCLLNEYIGLKHAAIVNDCLHKWKIPNTSVDLIASHGQTIYHAPKNLHQQDNYGNATLQIGDGDHIAVSTGIITVSDFRQKNIAAGGEGAPLALYGDYLLFSKEGEERILLNIGGIANLTFLPGNLDANEISCTDIGPGNTIMDAYIQQAFPGKQYDEHAMIAGNGSVNEKLLHALKQHEFFKQPFPKTTGPELFNLHYLAEAKRDSGTTGINAYDCMCTLNRFSADMIAAAIHTCFKDKKDLHIYSSGGGIHNPILMQHIGEQLPGCNFHSTNELGIEPDAKEAVLFAVLANECICGDPTVFSGKGFKAVTMGKLSFPS